MSSNDSHTHIYFAKRLSHFIRGYRQRSGITQSDFAKRVGLTRSTLSRIENDTENHLARAIALLTAFAQIEHSKVDKFITYLLNDEPELRTEQDLYPWQLKLVNHFGLLKQRTRVEFLIMTERVSSIRLARVLELATKLNNLDENKLEAIETLIDK